MQGKMLDMYTHMNLGNEEERKDEAILSIKSGVSFIGEIIKSTLGPKGSLKILQSDSSINVTNDGAFILKNLLIDSPSARILVDSSISQDYEEGDGTTSIAVLTSLILKHCYDLNIHPSKIIKGLSLSLRKIEEILEKKKFVATETDILNLVKTTLNSKILATNLETFSNICINAINGLRRRGEIDINLINIIKLEGDLAESMLMDGLVIDKELFCPRNTGDDISYELSNLSLNSYCLKNPKILLANTSLDSDKVKIFSSKISVNSIRELSQIEKAEKDKMKNKIDLICKYPIDLFINRQIIYDYPQQLLTKKGISFIENADFDNIERLQVVLGGTIIGHFIGSQSKLSKEEEDVVFKSPLNSLPIPSSGNLASTSNSHFKDVVLTTCEKVESVKIKDKVLTKFTCAQNTVSTIILHGSSKTVLDEAERSIHDALCVLKRIYECKNTPYLLYGGGNTEVALAQELMKYSLEIKTKESDVIVAFSNALMDIPKIICDNCGFDGDNSKNLLKSKYNSMKNLKNFTHGIDIKNGLSICMKEIGVLEGFEMKRRVITAACETAQTILKVDGVARCAPRERTRH